MVTWLTRSLLFIVAGAVLAYAVTAHNDTIDLQTTGVILLLVGVFDLLLNFALTMYYRHPTSVHSYERVEERPRAYEQRAYQPRAYERPRPYPELDDDRYATRPIRGDNPDWH
jgi:hypothetical protein